MANTDTQIGNPQGAEQPQDPANLAGSSHHAEMEEWAKYTGMVARENANDRHAERPESMEGYDPQNDRLETEEDARTVEAAMRVLKATRIPGFHGTTRVLAQEGEEWEDKPEVVAIVETDAKGAVDVFRHDDMVAEREQSDAELRAPKPSREIAKVFRAPKDIV